ncbi:MAG: glucokinase [Gammaproteobacteria bacterium]
MVADIGGTNARFAIYDGESRSLQAITHYSVSEFPNFDLALDKFLGEVVGAGNWCLLPVATCLAVACPSDTDIIQFTNSPWRIDRRQLVARLEQTRVDIINDFAAVGYAVTDLSAKDWHPVGRGEPQTDSPIAVLGPGTGLGVCSLVPVGSGFRVIEGEGGHVDFAPVDAEQVAVFNILSQRFGRVSVERLLSGAGIRNIYQALGQIRGKPGQCESPAEITAAALEQSCELAQQSLQMFFDVLGAVAGDLALTLGARGGVYIAGGIVPRLLEFLGNTRLRERFEAKGRFREYLDKIPLRVIVKSGLGLHGATRKIQRMTQ